MVDNITLASDFFHKTDRGFSIKSFIVPNCGILKRIKFSNPSAEHGSKISIRCGGNILSFTYVKSREEDLIFFYQDDDTKFISYFLEIDRISDKIYLTIASVDNLEWAKIEIEVEYDENIQFEEKSTSVWVDDRQRKGVLHYNKDRTVSFFNDVKN